MTGYKSKRAAARVKMMCQCSLSTSLTGDGCQYCNPEYMDDDALTIAYQSGYYDGKKAAQQAQKPYGYVSDDKNMEFQKDTPEIGRWVEVYNNPPQRTWVGLTDEELQPIADEYRILFGSWVKDFAKAIQAALRSKNT